MGDLRGSWNDLRKPRGDLRDSKGLILGFGRG